MKSLLLIVLLAQLSFVLCVDKAKVREFADKQWDCTTPSCSSRVHAGEAQPRYECAEFVSRSLAAGGYIDLDPHAPQTSYGHYHYSGSTYNLLWVPSLKEFLHHRGFKDVGKSGSHMEEACVVICNGGEGPNSHTAIGVGHDLIDAHKYHVPVTGSCISVDGIYCP